MRDANKLGEEAYWSPVLSNGPIFIGGNRHPFGIRQQQQKKEFNQTTEDVV